jgi:hypothetical protein
MRKAAARAKQKSPQLARWAKDLALVGRGGEKEEKRPEAMKTVSLSAHLVKDGFRAIRQFGPLDQSSQAVTNYSLAKVEGNAPRVT